MFSAKACDRVFYGIYCNKTCDCNCVNSTCNSVTGDCPSECEKGDPTVLVATFSVTGFLLVISLAAFLFYLVKKRLKKRKESDDNQDMWPEQSQDQGPLWSYTNLISGDASEEPKETKYRVHISDLENYIVQGRKNGTLKEEFEFITKSSPHCHVCRVGEKKENERKNRYSNILPYDYTRVILEKLPNDPHSDYINANYISGYKREKKYIAAQGPKPLRMADFWRMVWQEGSCKIIMVTNLIEAGETKCKKYWPKKTDHYGSLKIHLVESDVSLDFTIRTFILSQNDETREVRQFHFTTWPEKKTPLYTKSLLAFIGKVRDYQPLCHSPIVVHSSGGIGRTGAYILLDHMLDMVQWESHVNFVKCVCDMREQRMKMVETAEQYVFIYETLLDALWPFETSIQCQKFKVKVKEFKCIDPETGRTRMEEEFERINRLYPPSDNNNGQTQPLCWMDNEELNQTEGSSSSPMFLTFKEDPSCQHHLLTFIDVDGYCRRKAFMVTSLPNAMQLKEFWTTIYRSNTQTIVLLNDLQSIAEKNFSRYWPREGSTVVFGEFSIEYLSKVLDEDVMIRNFIITENNETKGKLATRKLKHFQLTNWNSTKKTPPSPMLLVNLIAKIEKWQQETPKHSVVVQCLDGIRASGLFCTCYFMCNKITLEQEVDVYLAVKIIRDSCSNFIEDFEQYSYCYTVAECFLERFRDYANFS